ncbi:hypothetical protein INT44_003043 [Umbelopsis vinacea]|uniref:mRNA m(6)A methyltransferase n=1 Tax=Umbelopsis vinacea TaxID=44442 RepID=A0A8H7UM54_9FUNG|nr:hypothetical protein INT44_003043 [Umbelopsis vinacea]
MENMTEPPYRWFDEVPPRKKFKQQHSGGQNHNYSHEYRQGMCPVALDELLQSETTSEEIKRLTWQSSLDSFKRHCDHGTKQEYVTAEQMKPVLRPTLSSPLTMTLYKPHSSTQMLHPKKLLPPQWIKCDIRKLDFDVIGKFTVILADPPWDIHMSLPYGTMTDDEMKDLNISKLQDQGLLFLWVTSRAMELGRECLMNWGYELVQELVWVKTNQLQRIIRTGRTGHWLNHSKEHCLIGRKGNDPSFNVGLDCDVLVSEVRETSRKPDELYDIINQKLRFTEMFGREHNLQPGWLTLGNQLKDSRIYEPQLVERYNAKYASHPIRLFSLPQEYR